MVNVVGLGYIGLPSALMLAAHGAEVVGTDYNQKLIETLRAGKTSFEEPGLAELFAQAQASGIRFSEHYQIAEIYIVAVPTPYDEITKKVDASYVTEAVRSVLEVCPDKAVIAIESTIPPGTIDYHIRPLTVGRDVHLVHTPERIIPGNMIAELKHNSRTIGADDRVYGKMIETLYQSFCDGEIVITDIRTAEMSKVVENTYRDINIAYANELAKICCSSGLDVYEIIGIANKHPRVNILSPGPGVGGHCISVDPWFLVGEYPEMTKLIRTARSVNDSMPEHVLTRINAIMMEKGLTDVGRVGLYGLTYKENVDDLRQSPSLQLLASMKTHLAQPLIKLYDPFVADDIWPNQMHDFDAFIDSVDMVVIMTGHDQIRENIGRLAGKIVLDTRNICSLEGTYRL